MEKTAVEWLVEQMINKLGIRIENTTDGCELVEQALEGEKRQIIDAHIDGFYSPPFGKSRNGEANDYYDKTYKSE